MREGFYIGPLMVHYYGVLIMLGVLAAAWLATREIERYGHDPETIWDLLPWILIAGIVGARIWHILTPPDSMQAIGITTKYYLTHPIHAISIWRGGLGIPGGVIGGALALYLYTRKNKMNFLTWADAIAPGLALAQAIGRWGNFVNQELYGAPSDLPWAIFIEPAYRIAGYKDVATYHPLFLYESIWNILTMVLLLWIARKFVSKLKPGYIFQFYLILYPIARFLLEFLRLDASSVAGINANQTLMAIIALSSLAILIIRERKGGKSVKDIIEENQMQEQSEEDEEDSEAAPLNDSQNISEESSQTVDN